MHLTTSVRRPFSLHGLNAYYFLAALITTACFGAAGLIIASSLGTFMVFDNKRRNKEQGVNVNARDISTKLLKDGPASPDFRWLL